MKKCPVATLVLSLALSGWLIPSASAVNLVTNGDFEGGLEPGPNGAIAPVGWQWFGVGDNTVALSTDTPSGTGSSADLDIQEVLGLPWLVQDVDVSMVATGTTLTLTASVKELRQFTPDFDAWIAAQVYLLPDSESGNILASGFAFYTSPTWQTQSFDVVKPSGANIARILFTPQDPGFGVGTGRYLVDNVMLTEPSAGLPGDYNLDGSVDAADYTVWRDNTEGLFTAADYTVWVNNFGATAGASVPASAVPEPSTWLSALLAVSFRCFLHQRKLRVVAVG